MNRRCFDGIESSGRSPFTLSLLATILCAASAQAAQGVTITNTTSNPVPVTGGVHVINTPTVQIEDSNPVSVRSAEDGAFQPFQAIGRGSLVDLTRADVAIATVPSGKRLVIEYVSATVQLPAGGDQHAQLILETCTSPDDTCIPHFVPLVPQGTIVGTDKFVAGQAVRLYSDADSTVRATLIRSPNIGNAGFDVSISGHFVTVP